MEKEEPNIEPRYMTSTKKHYYLAAVNENVQQLIKEEIDGLTRVLIELKSQYDIIRRESIDKKNQTDELCKKIDSLQKMDKKSKKKIDDANQQSDDLSNSIQAKRTRLNECIYQMKTLQCTISKLKQDNFLVQKKIMENENITKRLHNHFQKEIAKETQLKEKKNKVHSERTNQINKNEFEKDEQNLQLQYYRTIIDQKKMFIRSDDERKERQKKIAEEAKNNSADKQEVERRKVLCLLKLYNIYLESEMEKALRKNEQLENTYREIREICGSPSLKLMVDKILTKETNYNDSLAKVNELQNQIDVYDKDIAELEIKLKKLKNEVIFQEKNEKTISTLPTNIIQEDENKLINEEKKLINEEKILKEKLTQINLIYRKIMENIEFFIIEQKMSQEGNNGQEDRIIKKIYNYDDTNENFFQQATAAGQSTNYDQQSTLNANFNMTKSTLINKPIIMTTTTTDNFQKTKNRFLSRGTTPKNKIFDDLKIASEKMSMKDDSVKAPSEKEQNFNQNKIIPGFFDENDSLFDDLSNSNETIKNYNEYLNWLNKKFDKFFLCYNKEQFKAIMAEKGIKVHESGKEVHKTKQQLTSNDRPVERRATKKRRTRRFEGLNNKVHVDAGINKENAKMEDNEVEFDEDDLPPEPKNENEVAKLRKKDNKPSTDIFLRFLEEQENKTHEYIHERELRNKKK